MNSGVAAGRRSGSMVVRAGAALTLAVLALAAAGCGSQHPAANAAPAAGHSSSSPSSSASPSPTPGGPEQFAADVKASGAYNGEVKYMSYAAVVKLGRSACSFIADGGGTYSNLIAIYQKAKDSQGRTDFTKKQAVILVTSAVHNLCPQYFYVLPGGAP